MKNLLAFALASSFTLGLAATASAAFEPKDFYAPREAVMSQVDDARHERDRCIGLASGTAHHSCGTRTGGPVGGLH